MKLTFTNNLTGDSELRDSFLKLCKKQLSEKEIKILIKEIEKINIEFIAKAALEKHSTPEYDEINYNHMLVDGKYLIRYYSSCNYFMLESHEPPRSVAFYSIEDFLSFLTHYEPGNAVLLNLYKKVKRAHVEKMEREKGNIISKKTFYITGWNEWTEEDVGYNVDNFNYLTANNIFHTKGKFDKCTFSDRKTCHTQSKKIYDLSKCIKVNDTTLDSSDFYGLKKKSSEKYDTKGFTAVRLLRATVVKKDNGIVQLKIAKIRIFRPLEKNMVYYSKYRYYCQLSFNTRTGQTYIFSPGEHLDSGKNLPEAYFRPMKISTKINESELNNLFELGLPDDVIKYLTQCICEEKGKIYGFTPQFYINGTNPLLSLAMYNQNPLCNPLERVKHLFTKAVYDKINNSVSPCDEFLKFLDFPINKTTRKQFFEDISVLIKVYFSFDPTLSNYGFFKDFSKEELITLYKSKNSVFISLCGYATAKCDHADIYPENGPIFRIKSRSKNGKPISSKLFHDSNNTILLQYYEEIQKTYKKDKTKIINNLCREAYAAKDVVNILFKLRETKGINFRKKSIPFNSRKEYDNFINRSFCKEMTKMRHDNISSIYDLVTTKNELISFTKNEKKLEEQVGEYKFILPRTTKTLREIGRTMNICVGWYGQSAVKKELIIAVLYKNEVPVVCMELNGNSVMQVKTYSNDYVKSGDAETKLLFDWMKNHDLKTNTYDFNGPEIKEIQPKNLIINNEYIKLQDKIALRQQKPIPVTPHVVFEDDQINNEIEPAVNNLPFY